MKTKRITIEGVLLIVPESYHAPEQALKDFPACCGAGEGIGNGLIPERMYGLLISAACHIHDYCWKIAEATWADFHQSNYLFFINLKAIIKAKSANVIMRWLRYARATTYSGTVDTVGALIFRKIKGDIV